MATNDEIIKRLDQLDSTLCDRVKKVEEQVSDQERRLTRVETIISTINQRFDTLERMLAQRTTIEDKQWHIILILLAIIAVAIGGPEVAKLIMSGL